MSRRRRWWPSHRWLGRGRGQPRVLHLAPGQLTLMLWRSGHGENPPHVGPGCWGQIRKGKMLRKGWRSGKEKINAEWIFWENIISYKLSCHVAIRARAETVINTLKTFWQLTFLSRDRSHSLRSLSLGSGCISLMVTPRTSPLAGWPTGSGIQSGNIQDPGEWWPV